jgi:ribonuclease HI
MLVTINTDASFNRKYKKAAYAFWIVCNEERYRFAAMIKQPVSRPEEAEFMAIINAVHGLGFLRLRAIHKIIINTDCLNVIHLINRDKAKIAEYKLAKWGEPLYEKYLAVLKQFNLDAAEIEPRHVEAHKGSDTKRKWVNDWCDKTAKKVLREAINKQPIFQ